MFRAIGVLLIIWGLSTMLGGAFRAFEGAMIETFKALEAAAILSQEQMLDN